MEQLHELAQALRTTAAKLEELASPGPMSLEERRTQASAIDEARASLRQLSNIGLEPDDFRPGSECRRFAGQVDDGRRRLANALSIAVQSMFTAPDPMALSRDLQRAVRALRAQADAEDDLIGRAAIGRDVA